MSISLDGSPAGGGGPPDGENEAIAVVVAYEPAFVATNEKEPAGVFGALLSNN